MNLWTNEDINRILLQLDVHELPFKRYSLTKVDGAPNLIGRGGSAYVFEAGRRSGKPGKYALKVIGFSSQSVDSAYFNEAVEAQKEIGDSQDNVVKVYDYTELWVTLDSDDNYVSADKKKPQDLPKTSIKLQFILMENISPVIERTKAGNIKMTPAKIASGDEKEILKLAYDIGLALKHAHDKNILHRDVKLENVFYSGKKNQYKLGDFGIAKKTQDGFASTVAFTKGYAAPEVRGTAENDRYDNTADIYSFGMMLYVLANGLKFPDSNTYNVNSEVQYSKGYILPPPEKEDISEEFYYILAKACMYDPDLRFQSMEEMLIEIEKLMYSEGLGYKKEHKSISLIVGAILLGLGVVAWKLSMAPEILIQLTTWEYIFLLCGVLKAPLKIAKKETSLVGFAMLCIGIYLLIKTGFSWGMLILMLWMAFSSGVSSAFIGGGVLIANVMSLAQKTGEFQMYPLSDYSWVAITMISLAFILLYQYVLLTMEDRQYVYKLYKKGLYWILVCLAYGFTFLNGLQGKSALWVLGKAGIGKNSAIIQTFQGVDYMMVGLSGLAFCLFWIAREKVLIYFIKRQKKKFYQQYDDYE